MALSIHSCPRFRISARICWGLRAEARYQFLGLSGSHLRPPHCVGRLAMLACLPQPTPASQTKVACGRSVAQPPHCWPCSRASRAQPSRIGPSLLEDRRGSTLSLSIEDPRLANVVVDPQVSLVGGLPIAFAGRSKMGSGLSDHGASLVKIETKRPETRIPVN